MASNGKTLRGAGLGLRRELVPALRSEVPELIGFLELAPENWLEFGGRHDRDLRALAGQRPLVAHGLSLNLGGTAALDETFLRRVKRFLDAFNIDLFTEHLSWCADDGHLYDLLPLPFTGEAVAHVAARIRRTQDILERRIAVENASFYLMPAIAEMDEVAFIKAVLAEADCDLHLDVNNVYVNSVNFGFDPHRYITALPAERVVYMHMAGHYREAPNLIIDTHGAAVAEPVWALYDFACAHLGPRPTLLERDFNIPPLAELLPELQHLCDIQHQHQHQHRVRRHAA
ncbi:MAG TPA: DUF692 domain-containing protein [Gammaproteobacteria bacterium]|nr:DUF692 domain-containing protein [Gammaproteobacteria bacterium]